jgi:hypothetical protein
MALGEEESEEWKMGKKEEERGSRAKKKKNK